MICGIVLAAGRSRRMGEPKALLRVGDDTFLRHAVQALRDGGCAYVVVVTGRLDDETARHIAEDAAELDAGIAVNPAVESQQVDSLRIGLAALPPDAEAAVVAPVDVPDVSGALVRAVVDAYRRTGAPVALPAREGRHGHPVLFARRVFGELARPELPQGARTVIHAHAAELAEVPVDALPADVDTPDDYRRWRTARG
ncbi:MAG TPA: nucleotidyltransferase family protein [Longimicrobium sp.]|jgi:CTP:molybdopterin cytidylyltransferase MocA|nr:nucleotidyltransferase family protein [Longimicrobium sp.]